MILKELSVIIALLTLVLFAGCTSVPSQTSSSPAFSPVPDAPSQTPEPVVNISITGKETPEPVQLTDVLDNHSSSPVPLVQPVRTVLPDKTQNPLVAFQDTTLLTLDNLQGAKEGLILTYRTGDILRVQQKAEEYSLMIRRNSELPDTPSKMDYVRLNYYDYIEQLRQFSQSFKEGADRYIASDKASATSFFDAGIMASERADISDKRIRTFLREHVWPVQINQS